MPNPYIDKVNYDSTVYDIYDSAHGTLTNAEITTGTDTTPKFITAKVFGDAIGSLGGGTVTAVTAGTGLQVGDGTGSQTISTTGTLNHSNSISAGTVGTSEATSGSTLAVPYVTYDSNGHITVTGTHTHTVTGFASSSHVHGDINNNGTVTSNAVTPANGDYILITDHNATNADSVKRGIAIGTGTSKYLREDGTWQTVSTSDTKVTQTLDDSGSTARQILLAYGTGSTDITNIAYRSSNLTYTPSTGTLSATNLSGAITSSMVTTALGYTPYNSSNPNGYTSNVGTITGVSLNGTSVATSGVANLQIATSDITANVSTHTLEISTGVSNGDGVKY